MLTDDSDSYVSSEGEKDDEENEPLPGAAAALTALTHPTVPLGADFGKCSSSRKKKAVFCLLHLM